MTSIFSNSISKTLKSTLRFYSKQNRPQNFVAPSKLHQNLGFQFDRQSARFFEDIPEKKPRVSTSYNPSISQKTKVKFMRDPYLVDKRGRPVFDYFKLQRFDTAKYPAIESQPFIFVRKEKDELRVKSPQEVKGRFEYRAGIHSDEFTEAGATEQVRKIFSWDNASTTEINKMKVRMVIAMFQKKDGDTGSTGVQAAVITQKLRALADHLKSHKKDKRAKRSMQQFTDRRRKLLKKLRELDGDTYYNLIKHVDQQLVIEA